MVSVIIGNHCTCWSVIIALLGCVDLFCRDGLLFELENGKPRLVLAKCGNYMKSIPSLNVFMSVLMYAHFTVSEEVVSNEHFLNTVCVL